jgi:ribosome-binding protein aMBF1 (putative translation factor)
MLRMKSERIKRGLTFTDLSYKVQIHPATLGKIETKKMIAYEPHKKKLSKFFDVPAEELFKDINPDNTEGGL